MTSFREPSKTQVTEKNPGSAHDTTIKPTVLDAHAHLCLLASEEKKVILGFYDVVAEQFYIAKW